MATPDLQLYHGLASTCSKKVRLCLYEKHLAFTSRLLDLQKFEQHQPDYLALNPKGVVPTLVHDGKPITESSRIIVYLDDVFSETPLRPADSAARADVDSWLKFSDGVAYDAVAVPTWMRLSAGAMRDFSPEQRSMALARIPTAERRQRWKQVSSNGFTEAELKSADAKMHQSLERCETALATASWLAGPSYTLADIAMVPFIDRIRNLKPEILAPPLYPRLNAWYRRLRARPAFEKAFDFRDDPRAATMMNI